MLALRTSSSTSATTSTSSRRSRNSSTSTNTARTRAPTSAKRQRISQIFSRMSPVSVRNVAAARICATAWFEAVQVGRIPRRMRTPTGEAGAHQRALVVTAKMMNSKRHLRQANELPSSKLKKLLCLQSASIHYVQAQFVIYSSTPLQGA